MEARGSHEMIWSCELRAVMEAQESHEMIWSRQTTFVKIRAVMKARCVKVPNFTVNLVAHARQSSGSDTMWVGVWLGRHNC